MRKSFEQIIAGLHTVYGMDSALGQFDLNPGGPSPWAVNNAPSPHWWGEVMSTKTVITTIGGLAGHFSARRVFRVIIEGWYPFSERLQSASVWRPLLDRALDHLEANRTLGLALILERGPIIEVDSVAKKQSANQNDTAIDCHYVRLACWWADECEVIAADL